MTKQHGNLIAVIKDQYRTVWSATMVSISSNAKEVIPHTNCVCPGMRERRYLEVRIIAISCMKAGNE